jgi:hypothetical protein
MTTIGEEGDDAPKMSRRVSLRITNLEVARVEPSTAYLLDQEVELEEVTAMRLPASKVQPKVMDTVSLMLWTARRIGRSRE